MPLAVVSSRSNLVSGRSCAQSCQCEQNSQLRSDPAWGGQRGCPRATVRCRAGAVMEAKAGPAPLQAASEQYVPHEADCSVAGLLPPQCGMLKVRCRLLAFGGPWWF